MAAKIENQVKKLALYQMRGCLQPSLRSTSVKFFNTYSRSRCFKLNDLLDSKGEIKNGHVILGFTKDGCHLISYSLEIDTRLDLPQPLYSYTLHWWWFRYCKPLVKVHSVPLFSNHDVYNALHLIISQSLDEKQLIIWGRSSPSQEQSCRCYVTICAAVSSKTCNACQLSTNEKCLEHSFSVHFTYETLPPYPVFLPSVSLSIPGIVLFNCGDSLVAMKCSPCLQSSHIDAAMQDFAPNISNKNASSEQRSMWHEAVHVENTDNSDDDQLTTKQYRDLDDNGFGFENRQRCNDSLDNHIDLLNKQQCKLDSASSPLNSPQSVADNTASRIPMYSPWNPVKDINSNTSCSHTNYSYKVYYKTDSEDVFDDCDDIINHEIPVNLLSNNQPLSSCDTIYGVTEPSVLVCQAFLDMEECINDLIQSHEELRDRYKSLRDYDCQLLSVCPEGEVIVMVNVLVNAKRKLSCHSDGLQVSPSPGLHQTGFVFSWNIWNGQYRTLHYMDVEDHPSHGFTKSESSMEKARCLRKDTAIPVGFRSQVRVFSNHTVFSDKSLKYLLHPFLPIVLVL